MLVERHTYESAKCFEEKMRERGMLPMQGNRLRLEMLRSLKFPMIRGPRPIGDLIKGVENNNVYTWFQVAILLRHPLLCWHEREDVLKRHADRPLEERHEYWDSVLTALALGDQQKLPRCCKLLKELGLLP